MILTVCFPLTGQCYSPLLIVDMPLPTLADCRNHGAIVAKKLGA